MGFIEIEITKHRVFICCRVVIREVRDGRKEFCGAGSRVQSTSISASSDRELPARILNVNFFLHAQHASMPSCNSDSWEKHRYNGYEIPRSAVY